MPSQHLTSTASFENWEESVPLDEVEETSVNLLKVAGEHYIWPRSTDERTPSRPPTPLARATGRPLTPSSATQDMSAANILHLKEPIQTTQQFYDWFSLVERSVAHSEEAQFRAHVTEVAERLETCGKLIDRIDEIDAAVDDMLEGRNLVERGGNSLKDACENLLEQREKLLATTNEIRERLGYFQIHEYATRMLNHPGESLVLQTDFLDMVERVDICIQYLQFNRHHLEAELYLLRYHQCMTRAMTLIKMYFVGSLRALTVDISKRLSDKDISSTAQMHLLYTRFRSVSPRLAPLLAELERRTRAYPEELSALLSECHGAYLNTRKALLVGRLTQDIKGLDPARTELVELTRAGCHYLKQLCVDEYNLFRAFFHSGERQLYEHLEGLCDYLYDDLRPRILHELRLTVLCEVCTVIRALMVLDSSTDSDPSDEESEGERIDVPVADEADSREHERHGKMHISHFLNIILHDAQTRLVFRAQSLIQSEIRNYTASPGDLAYPDKLTATHTPIAGIQEKDSIGQLYPSASSSRHDTWYPTLQATVRVLTQLRHSVKPAIFEDIALEALDICHQSLIVASENIKSRNPPSSTLDGQLFLVRHLQILKDFYGRLDLTDSASRVDKVTETWASVVTRTTSLLPEAVFSSLRLPRTNATATSARQRCDHDLEATYADIVFQFVEPLCQPMHSWLHARPEAATEPNDREEPPMVKDSSTVKELYEGFRFACERDLHAFVSRVKLYVTDRKTVGMLLTRVEDKIVNEYAAFQGEVTNLYSNMPSPEALKENLVAISRGDLPLLHSTDVS